MNKHQYPPRNLTATEIEKLLSYIPPCPAYREWLQVISAVCHELGDEAEAERILTRWSPDYGQKTTADVIESFRGNYMCKAGTLIWHARQNGYTK